MLFHCIITATILRVIVILAAGNRVIKLAQLGIRSYLCNSLTDSNDACKAYMYVCVHIKCGHNINGEILQIHTNKHRNLPMSSFQ